MEITLGMVQVPAADGRMSASLARPLADGTYPGVVVVQEAFGLNAHIKDVAARLAREGYVTLAPDLYYREPNAVVGYDNLPEAIRLMMALSDDNIVKDMGAAIAYLQQQPAVRAERIGVTGFCMGGRVAFLTACLNPAVKAAVPFYGGGIGSARPPGKAPLDHAETLSCPVLLFYGEKDAFISLDEVERIKARLAELKRKAEVVVYPGADHGFFCNERASYHAASAKDAWSRLLAFFEKHLKA
jgi:carboxymethylenebutenolidase